MNELAELIEALHGDDAEALLALCDDDTIAAHEGEITDAYRAVRAGEVEGVEADDEALLDLLESGLNIVQAERTRRTEAAEAAAADEEARVARLAERDARLLSEDGGEGESSDDESDDDEDDAEKDKASQAASRKPSIQQLAAARRHPDTEPHTPAVTNMRPRWKLDNGTPADFADLTSIAERMIEAREAVWNSPPGFSQKVTVASLKVDRPEELTIRRGADPAENQAKIDDVVEPAFHPDTWSDEQQAIVASGGWCAPGQSRYDIPSISSAARPFRDSLPRVGAERGTVNFVRAARLAIITANAANAGVTTWENATDQTPGGSTKTRQTHACRTVQTEEIGAIVARMRFGNFQQRAFPEDVAHVLELLAARHARVAETRLLDALIADVNIDVAQTGVLGTARDVKHHFSQAAAEIRFTERMLRASRIRAAVSDVVLDMIVADLAFQQASGEIDALLADEATARAIVNASTVTATFLMDTPTGSDAFVTNSDGENLADWPDNFEVPIYPDGTVAFADGGELNLGIVRDSTLNNTNDYEVFMETFEGLLWLGPYAKTLTLTTCPTGESTLPNADAATICGGS